MLHIRFEPNLSCDERSIGFAQAIEKAGPNGYVIEPLCCNYCGETNVAVATLTNTATLNNNNNDASFDATADATPKNLSTFQCRLCGVYYSMCSECVDDQYEHPAKTKCPIKYGCMYDDRAEPSVLIAKTKNLVYYDAFGRRVCREYTDEEASPDGIREALARGMADVLRTNCAQSIRFLYYVYYVKGHNDPEMRAEARYMKGLVLAKVIRPALGSYIMNNVFKPILQSVVEREEDWARCDAIDEKNISDLWAYHMTNVDSNHPELKKHYKKPRRKIDELSSSSELKFYDDAIKCVFADFVELDQSGVHDGKPLLLSFCWANGDEFHIRRCYKEHDTRIESFEEVFIPFSMLTDEMWEVAPFSRFSKTPRFMRHHRPPNGFNHLDPHDAVMCFISTVQ